MLSKFNYFLANPMNKEVKHIKQEPKIGDKVKIICFDLFTSLEARKLKDLNDELTVEEVQPILVGDNGNYHYEYNIYTKEFPLDCILGWHYKII